MRNIIDKFKNLTEIKKVYAMLGLCAFGLAIIFLILCLCKVLAFGWFFGILLGTGIEFLSYTCLWYSTKLLMNIKNVNGTLFGVGLTTIRFILYLAGLLIAALCEFYWKHPNILAVFGVFIAYLPLQPVILICYKHKKENE